LVALGDPFSGPKVSMLLLSDVISNIAWAYDVVSHTMMPYY